MSLPPQKFLYRIGQPAKEAYFVKSSEACVSLGDFKPQLVRAEPLIVGALEYFLKDTTDAPPRLLNLSVASSSQVTPLPFSELEKGETDYAIGFALNVFLARTIEITNDYLVQASIECSSSQLRRYQLRAVRFKRLVDEVFDVGTIHKSVLLVNLAGEFRCDPLYQEGKLFAQEQPVPSIRVSPIPLSRFVQYFKKNSQLCREGNSAGCLYILLKGRVKATRGQQYIATVDMRGEAFGELGLFLEGKRTASLTAVEDTSVYVVKKDTLRAFHAQHRDLFFKIAKVLSQRIQTNLDRIKRLQAMGGCAEGQKPKVDLEKLELESRRTVGILRSALKQVYADTPHPAIATLLGQTD